MLPPMGGGAVISAAPEHTLERPILDVSFSLTKDERVIAINQSILISEIEGVHSCTKKMWNRVLYKMLVGGTHAYML
jgi:hypothetical protein